MKKFRKLVRLSGKYKEVYTIDKSPLWAVRVPIPKDQGGVINADFGGIRTRLHYYGSGVGDYGHEVGHNWGLPHEHWGIMLYASSGYNPMSFWTILPQFTSIKASRGSLKKRKDIYYGDKDNAIVIYGGERQQKRDRDITFKGKKIILPYYKSKAKKYDIDCILYYAEVEKTGMYHVQIEGKATYAEGKLVLKVAHSDQRKKGKIRNTTRGIQTKRENFSGSYGSLNCGRFFFEKGKSYSIFIYCQDIKNKAGKSKFYFEKIKLNLIPKQKKKK